MNLGLKRGGTIAFTAAFFALAFANYVSAADLPNPLGTNATFGTIITSIINWANAIAIPLTALMVVIAGYLYLTGGGSPERITRAHRALVWAMIGLVVIILSSSVVAILRNVFGA